MEKKEIISNFIHTGEWLIPNSQLPKILDTIVLEDAIEIVYKVEPSFTYTNTSGWGDYNPIIYKVRYSCKDGMRHSETIMGRYIPPSDESYKFDD